MRALRAVLLALGLLPALVLVGVAAYGFVAPNRWEVRAETEVELPLDDLQVLTDNVARWPEWVLADVVGEDDFTSVLDQDQIAGGGATVQWMTGFLTGDAQLMYEVEMASSYTLVYQERRAGRPSATVAQPEPEPTAWRQIDGELDVELLDDGRLRVVLSESGRGGPRPIGPFVVARLQDKQQDVVEAKLTALVDQAAARAERRRALRGP